MTFETLEQAVRSQFIFLHRYEGETEYEWVQRSGGAHRLTCDSIEILKGAAIMVFLGLLEEYRLDEDDAAEYLGIEYSKVTRYLNLYERCMDKAERIQKRGGKLKLDSPEAKCWIKTGMVKSWLKANAR